MRIKKLIIENFRAYKDIHYIDISDFTTIIGKNDAGKSTILESLDIFFSGPTKIDKDDLSRHAVSEEITIGVVFSGYPDEIDIDRGALTSLTNERLLNKDGDFEVRKTFNTRLTRISAKIFARAEHPSTTPFDKILNLKNTDLKALVKERNLTARCDLNNNPSMRRALLGSVEENELGINTTDVSLGEGDAASIWKALERYLPIYTLFKADRVSSDQDPEAQNPMKAAVARAVADLSEELEKMAAEVREKVEETARRTIGQMQESYPDLRLASELTPRFQEPKWSSIFKIDLTADDGVPLNKRGSGVRRLILMSFFQAEANRLKAERLEGQHLSVPVIYAIEEPETSQHPDNQARIVEALLSVVEAGDQVLITTHNPNLAELLPLESVRFVDRDPESDEVRVRNADDGVLEEVVDTLGVLPTAIPNTGVKVAVLTEGKTDIDALRNFYDILTANGDIKPFNVDAVFWAIGGGGSTVKDWLDRRYLDRLNIPQVIFIDSDKDGPTSPESRKAREIIAMIGARSDLHGFITHRREIENFLHPDVLVRCSSGTLELDPGTDLDWDRLPLRLGDAIAAARPGTIDFNPVDRDGNALSNNNPNKTHCKKIITSYLFRQMTADEIKQRSDRGDGSSEVLMWLEAIAEHVR